MGPNRREKQLKRENIDEWILSKKILSHEI